MSDQPAPLEDADGRLLALYDAALPSVYGYLLARCRQRALAEELTADTFLAAVAAVRRDHPPALSTPWLIGIARHKLVDHWRREVREERGFVALRQQEPVAEDAWEVHLDSLRARATLDALGPQHRAALTLRYLDDLSVSQVAAHLDRGVHATEALLVRARQAFRRAYSQSEANNA